MTMSDWHDVGAPDQFPEDAGTPVQAGGVAIAMFRLGDELFALRDLCTHGNALLSDGYVEDGCVECPLHQGLFDIRSGAVRCAPLTEPVRTFPVRVVAGRVQVSTGCAWAEERPAVTQASARITGIERPAADVAVISLATEPLLDYRPGQYLDVLLENGERRSYSMASLPGEAGLELHIRHMPGGLFTDRVFGGLASGDTLRIEGPAGSFTLSEFGMPAILLASGTGFAPIKAMVAANAALFRPRAMHLYWGGRRRSDLYMDTLCRRWAEQYPWLTYVPVLSDLAPEDGWMGRTGFVHRAVMEDFPDLSGHEVYACGAPQMVEAARADFVQACRLPADNYYADAFLSKADSKV